MKKYPNQPDSITPLTLTEQLPENTASSEISDIQKSVIENTTLVKFGRYEIPAKWAKELEQFISETNGRVSKAELEQNITVENNQYKITWPANLDLRGCTGLSKLPSGLKVGGDLNLKGCTGLIELPSGLKVVGSLDLRGCTGIRELPVELKVDRNLYLEELTGIRELPAGLKVGQNLYLARCTGIRELPAGLNVRGHLNLLGCTGLRELPSGLKVGGDLSLSGCTGLRELPSGLNVGGRLSLSGCTGLRELPSGLNVGGSLNLSGCTGLRELPSGLNVGGDLNLSGCTGLRELPAGLKMGESLYLFDCTGLRELPAGLNVGGSLYLRGCTGLRELPTGLNAKSIEFDAVHSKFFTISQLSNLKDHLVKNLHWQITGEVKITIPTFIPHIESGLGKGDIEPLKDLANLFQVQQENINPQKIQETLDLLHWTEVLIKEGFEDILHLTAEETDETKIKRFIDYRTRKDQILHRLRSVISKPLLEAVKAHSEKDPQYQNLIEFIK